MTTAAEDIRDVRAADLKEGVTVDMEATVVKFGDGESDGYLFAAQCEFASVLDDSTPAEPVDGEEAVLIYTDQGNYKVPARWALLHIAHLDRTEG